MNTTEPTPFRQGPTRRTVTAIAWTVPTVALVVATPAAAASNGDYVARMFEPSERVSPPGDVFYTVVGIYDQGGRGDGIDGEQILYRTSDVSSVLISDYNGKFEGETVVSISRGGGLAYLLCKVLPDAQVGSTIIISAYYRSQVEIATITIQNEGE